MSLDRASQEEVNDYNDLYRKYSNFFAGSPDIKIDKESLFRPWRDMFDKGRLTIQATEERNLAQAIQDKIKVRPKNLTKR